MDRAELIKMVAYAYDALNDAKRESTVATAPAIAAVESVLEGMVDWLQEADYSEMKLSWSLDIITAFVVACPRSPYTALAR